MVKTAVRKKEISGRKPAKILAYAQTLRVSLLQTEVKI